MSYQGFLRRLSAEERDFYESKKVAAEFYRLNGIPEQIESALNQLILHKPGDVHGYLANYFANLCDPARISRLKASEVFDAQGQLTVEVELFCLVCNKEKRMSSAAIASLSGFKETSVDRRTSSQDRVDHVVTAVQWINEPLNNMLQGQNPCDQTEVDRILSSFFMSRYLEEKNSSDRSKEESSLSSEPEVVPPSSLPTQSKDKKSAEKGKDSSSAEKTCPPPVPPEPILPGSLAVGSASLAVAKAGARLQGVPLYRHIAALRNRETPAQLHVPVSLVTLLSCGRTSPGKLSLLEEIILIPKAGQRVKQIITMTLELQKEMTRIINASTKAGAPPVILGDSGAPALGYDRPEQPLDLIAEACANIGVALGTEIHIALNCAASEIMDYSKGKYEVATGTLKSPDELMDMYQALISKYPAVVAIIDPFRKEDVDQWEKLSHLVEGSCSLVTDLSSCKSKASSLPGVSAYILKHTDETTVSELIGITSEHQGSLWMGTTSSEPCLEDSVCDIAVGLGLNYVKLGGLSGAERMAKYNRLICIEEDLVQEGILASRDEHGPPLFAEKLQEQPPAAEGPLSDTV